MVEVIIPAYNAAAHLERAVSSALMQPECRVILVDDGSTDGTASLCQELSQHPRVQVLHQRNRGVSAARNAGMTLATAEWLLFLDADDELIPGSVGKLMALAEDAQAVQGELRHPGEKRKVNSTLSALSGREMLRQCLNDPTAHLHTHGWLLRREICGEQFDETLRLGEDGEWMLRVLSRAQGIRFLPVETYCYHLRADSAVHGGGAETVQAYLKTLTAAQKTLDSLGEEKAAAQYRLTHLLLLLTHGLIAPGTAQEAAGQRREMRELCRTFFREDWQHVSLWPRNGAQVVLLLLKMHAWELARQGILYRQRQNRWKMQRENESITR